MQHIMKENLLLMKFLLEPYKYMNEISKNVYIDKLDDTINKYSKAYHSTIKMKPADIKSKKFELKKW